MGKGRRFLRTWSWPLRRLVEPRFADINRRIASTKESVHEESLITRDALQQHSVRLEDALASFALANTESITYVGKELRQLHESVDELAGQLADLRGSLDGTAALDRRVDELIDSNGEGLDATVARLLNFAESHRGFAARQNLWLNPPVTLDYSEDGVRVGGTNERIVEVPYALRALSRVPVGGRVLDVGASESSVSLSLASLGYDTVALDLNPYRFSHPGLEPVAAKLEAWEPASDFDAILCISTIEHVGLGWYGEEPEPEGADRRALDRLGTWLKPDGVIVLTVPYGAAGVDEVQRTYNAASLARLLEGWSIEDRTIVAQDAKDGSWLRRDDVDNGRAVAMVTVTHASSS
jgi:SAM-dependent methyltransferase